MFQFFKEEIVEEIIKCDDPKSVESFINNEITDLKKKGYINHLIMRFIQKLDMKLITFTPSESAMDKIENIRFARQILLNKILKGVDA
ncbi:MAG TPA: hypothetical protein VF868_08765 [Bacteroidia bacterium]|jgi:hypothetical protein